MLPNEFILALEKYKDNQHLDFDLIKKACFFADEAHQGQFRHSKKPYITHPLDVAYYLLEYNFDSNTICAGILHDVLEDTEVSEEDILKNFNKDILNLVIGVTKLNKIKFSSVEEGRVENFRKFILAFVEDIRILVVKLFDRLNNIRTLQYIEKEEKRKRIAQETLDIYAPLAQRVSLHEVKDELEQTSFAVLEPKVVEFIQQETSKLLEETKDLYKKVEKDITKLLQDNNIKNFKISGRIKKPYSIWRKMNKKSYSFNDITDIIAFRIIVQDIEECYKVFYLLHSKYKSIFSRFKDYISYPKLNNYQSLHTCIFFNNNEKIEFQIRDIKMNEHSENGIAVHWNYKNPTKGEKDLSQYLWLQNLTEILHTKEIPFEDIYAYSKMEIFTEELFVFTPKGEVISLPKDACVLDFAYSIHSNLGDKCTGALIDGVYKSIYTKLKNGQKIEVMTDDKQEPSAIWLSFVKTGIAKVLVKKHLKQKYRQQIREQAHAILSYSFEKEGFTFYPELDKKIAKSFNIKSEDTLLENIVEGNIKISKILEKLYPDKKLKQDNNCYQVIQATKHLDNTNICFTNCCFPVYKDSIMGFLLPDNTIEVHNSNCELVKTSIFDLPYVNLAWTTRAQDFLFKAKIKVVMVDEIGALAKITKIIAKSNIQIYSIISSASRKDKGKREEELSIIIYIKNTEDLKNIIMKLYNSNIVLEAKRLIN